MSQEIFLEMTFDSGHRIVGHKGKCARLHGHTYRAEIWMQGDVNPDTGFVVDFGDVKDLVNEWDHRLLLWNEDPFYHWLCAPARWTEESGGMKEGGPFPNLKVLGIVPLNFNPTAENMAMSLSSAIRDKFNLQWVRMQLWETPKSMARGQA